MIKHVLIQVLATFIGLVFLATVFAALIGIVYVVGAIGLANIIWGGYILLLFGGLVWAAWALGTVMLEDVIRDETPPQFPSDDE